MNGIKTRDLQIGDSAQFTKTVSESDIYLFAGITGDKNPAHIDESYTAGTCFKKRISHGMLPAGFVSAVLGTRLPGPGTVSIKQNIFFRAPVYIGDTITAKAEVVEVDVEKNRARLKTVCTNQEGTLVLDGDALVSPPK